MTLFLRAYAYFYPSIQSLCFINKQQKFSKAACVQAAYVCKCVS